MTADPTLNKRIFSADPKLFDPFGTAAVAPLTGEGSLFILRGDAHRRERKLLGVASARPSQPTRTIGSGETESRIAALAARPAKLHARPWIDQSS